HGIRQELLRGFARLGEHFIGGFTLDLELEPLALPDITEPGEAQPGQSTDDRLALRIEDLGFGHHLNDDTCHACLRSFVKVFGSSSRARSKSIKSGRLSGSRSGRRNERPVVVTAPRRNLESGEITSVQWPQTALAGVPGRQGTRAAGELGRQESWADRGAGPAGVLGRQGCAENGAGRSARRAPT